MHAEHLKDRELFQMPTEHPKLAAKKQGRNFNQSFGAASSRDEMNLAEFPLAVLSTRVNPSVKTLEFKDYLRKSNGELVERKWIITGADKFGLPTSTDDDVVLGLMRMTMDQGFRDPKVYFTRYELLKTLRWSTEGRSYSRLIKSLDRLSGVRIRSSNSFYDNSTKSYQTCNFGIIDAYEINDERNQRNGEGEASKSFFIWSEMIFDSFKAGFVKKLDLEYYFALRSAVSRRLYRYLDKHFYYKSSLELPLTVLAFEKIGLSRSYKYISSIKQQLEPGGRELVETGFLDSFEFAGSGQQTVVRFNAKRNFTSAGIPAADTSERLEPRVESRADSRFEHNTPSSSSSDTLLDALVQRGIARPQAQKLLLPKQENDRLKIQEIIKHYDELIATGDRRISRNKVGFLYRAVENSESFQLPKAVEPQIPTRKRPELKLFQQTLDSSKETSPAQEAYKIFVESKLSEGLKSFDTTRLTELRSELERKMAFLKPILSKDRFEEAISGCLREELLKVLKVPTFELWSRSKE